MQASNYAAWRLPWPNVNPLYLIDSRGASLGSYVAKSINIFHCPTDRYLSTAQRTAGYDHRLRSISMNAAVGGGNSSAGQPGYKPAASLGWANFFFARKTSDLNVPGPAESWVFTDENPDSIDDSILYSNPAYTDGLGSFTELPGSDHNGACGVTFCGRSFGDSQMGGFAHPSHGPIHSISARQHQRHVQSGSGVDGRAHATRALETV